MRYVALLMVLVLLGRAEARDDEHTQVLGGARFTSSRDVDMQTFFLGTTYGFKKFDAEKAPYNEALFLSRKPETGVFGEYTTIDVDGLDGSELRIGIPLRYADPEYNYTGGLRLGGRLFDQELGVNDDLELDAWLWTVSAGYFVGERTELGLSYGYEQWDWERDQGGVETDDQGIDRVITFYAKAMTELFDDKPVNGEFAIDYIKSPLAAPTATHLRVRLAGDVYLSPKLGLGVQAQVTAGDVDSGPLSPIRPEQRTEGVELGVRLSYFVGPRFGLRVFATEYWDDNTSVRDETRFGISMVGRF
jgi:hypothetical protein